MMDVARTRTGVRLLWGGVLLVFFVVGGCASSSPRSEADGETNQHVTVYDIPIPDAAYETIDQVSAGLCASDVYADVPSREAGVDELVQRAAQKGANALVGVSCQRGANPPDCSKALRCTGTAVQMASVESVPQIAARRRNGSFGATASRKGTGWVVAPGVVVTSHLVVRGRSEFSLAVKDTTVSATLVGEAPLHNLALLKVEQSSLLPPPLPLASETADTGEHVFTMGRAADAPGAGLHTATGILSAQAGALGDSRVYRTTIVSPFEQEGAPLLDARGQVIGVLVPERRGAGFGQASAGAQASYAVKANHLRQLMERSDRVGVDEARYGGEETSIGDPPALPTLLERLGPSVLVVTAQ